MVATIAPQGLSNVPVGFESLVGDTQNLQDRLFALLCRAIAFPMSKRNSARPWKIVVSRKDLLDPAVVEKKLGIVVEVSGSETSSAAAPDLRDYACHQCGNMMFRVFRCGKCRAVNYCGAKCESCGVAKSVKI